MLENVDTAGNTNRSESTLGKQAMCAEVLQSLLEEADSMPVVMEEAAYLRYDLSNNAVLFYQFVNIIWFCLFWSYFYLLSEDTWKPLSGLLLLVSCWLKKMQNYLNI